MGRTRTLLAVAVGLTLLALVAVPASAARHHSRGAPVKFGAALNPNVDPANSSPPHTCAHEDSGLTTDPCTWMMLNSEVGSPGAQLKAPANGVITQIWVIAGHKGQFTPVVGFLTNVSGDSGHGRITAHGPVIHHGTSRVGDTIKVLKFPVQINVKKGEVLGIRTKATSILRCDSGSVRQLLFQPPLTVGAAAVANQGHSDCSLLIEAVMNPA